MDNGAIMLMLVLYSVGLFLAVGRYRGNSRLASLLGSRRASAALLAGATLVVLATTLYGSTSPTGRVNLVPGASIAAVFGHDTGNALDNVFGNILLFVPLGFLGVLATRRRPAAVTALACGMSVLIEVSQFMLGHRWTDIDDVLLNTLGAFLGALAATTLSPTPTGPARPQVDPGRPDRDDQRDQPRGPLQQGAGGRTPGIIVLRPGALPGLRVRT